MKICFYKRLGSTFLLKEEGITSIEYGLIALALAVLVVTILYGDNSFIQALENKFSVLSLTIIDAVISKN